MSGFDIQGSASSPAAATMKVQNSSLPSVNPPRKRLRTDEPESYPMESEEEYLAGEEPKVTRDKKYYIDGADCVVKVEDTLFRVHRFLLARDSSVFQDMFSLPEADNVDGKSAQEGSGDARPICLYGDTADDFRTFLSIMYALPSELQMYNSPDADISKLLIVASITNKYHFISTSSWAVSAVYSVTSGAYGSPTDPLADLTRISSSALTRILEVAIRCGHSRLVDYVVECWSNRILNRGLKPRIAMHVADRWGIDSLRGVAYYVQLMQIGSVFEAKVNGTASESSHSPSGDHSAALGNTSPSGEEYDDSEDAEESLYPLTQAQLTRLLSGFYSLVALWDKLRAAPPKFVRPEGCTFHNHGCLAVFRDEWTTAARHERTQRYGSADVVGRLRCMQEQMRTNTELACQLSPMCRKEALAAVKALVKEVQEGLAARFVDLTSRFR